MTTEQLNAAIADKNRAFQAATSAGRRIMVARDVLERIATGQYCPLMHNWADGDLVDEAQNVDLQPAVLQGEGCECCAVGALVISLAGFTGKGTIRDLFNIGFKLKHELRSHMVNDDLFTAEQLVLIELAFEMGGGFQFRTPLSLFSRGSRAIEFGHRYSTPMNRMVAIMENIIENNGQFQPA